MDYEPRLVLDERLYPVEKLEVPLFSGPSQSNYRSIPATSASTSSVTFNYQSPSESTVISREMLVESTMTFTMALTTAGAGAAGVGTLSDRWEYGHFFGPQSFPYNSLIQNASVTLNNSTVSLSQQDVFWAMQKCLPQSFFQRYQAGAPCMPDRHVLVSDQALARNGEGQTYTSCGPDQTLIPRGSYEIISVAPATTTTMVDAAGAGPFALGLVVTIRTREPIFVSPLLVSGENNCRAMYGLNRMTLQFNLDSTGKRAWYGGDFTKSTNPNANNATLTTFTSASLTAITNVNLLVHQMTVQPNQLLPSRCLLPYKDINVYKKSFVSLANTDTITNDLDAVQLGQIPSKIYIYFRKQLGLLSVKDLNYCTSIDSVNITFNNQSGLLSSCSQIDLWRISAKNGYQGSFPEWKGVANRKAELDAVGNVAIGDVLMPLSGSILVLDPARDLSLPSFLTNGSLGSFSLQIKATITNNTGTGYAYDSFVMIENNGVFSLVSGAASTLNGMYDMSMVEKVTSSQKPINESDASKLMYGSGFDDQIASSMRKIKLGKDRASEEVGSGASSGGSARSGGRKAGLDSLIF